MHQGSFSLIGELGGVEEMTLNVNNTPGHTHAIHALPAPGDAHSPEAGVWAGSGSNAIYSSAPPDAVLAGESVGEAGSDSVQPHNNMQPFLCLNFIIALQGIFPSQA
jgi:microcystin-dependent protein